MCISNEADAEIESRVYRVISETFSTRLQDLRTETFVKGHLGADSMQLIALMIALDEEFDAEFEVDRIPDGDVTVGWICEFVRETTARAPASRT